jgi:hypothetical protein
MNTTFRMALLALLAVLALSAVAASAAQAEEAPFFKIGGERLAEGQSKEVTAKTTEKISIEIGPIRMRCSLASASGAKLLGSHADEPSRVEMTTELTGCVVEHAGCEVVASIKSEPLLAKLVTLGLSVGERGKGKIALLLTPKTGSRFMLIRFNEGCVYGAAVSVEGEVAAELHSGEKPIEVGKEPAEAKTVQLVFPTNPIKSCWLVKEGTGSEHILKELQSALWGGGSLEGSATLELASAQNWGVFD